jgi:hypothetical protein
MPPIFIHSAGYGIMRGETIGDNRTHSEKGTEMSNQRRFFSGKTLALFSVVVIVGLYSAYRMITWIEEAAHYSHLAYADGLGKLPFLMPLMRAIFAGILAICCLLILFNLLFASRSKQAANSDDGAK